MATKFKIAVVGLADAILPFKMIGFETHSVVNGEEAGEMIDLLSESGDYGIIYLTEDMAAQIPEKIRDYDAVMTPAVILIPTHKEQLGIGLARIQENVEKAVGADIL
ncbi:V-type ATP synthase subunit F [Aerococcaceae bacterium DSM 111176]|nr:V-type ATP synthase subunit F [Aerococcaceae bacterium DSM 111176]